MKLSKEFKTERLFFRSLDANDANEKYKNWLEDSRVNQYLEVRHHIPDITMLKKYIIAMNDSTDSLLLGIFLREIQHIGNIKLGPIDWKNKRAGLGVMIGDRGSWCKGYATEAITAITHYALNQLNLNRVESSCYHSNIGSFKAFMKAGYEQEGSMKKYWNTETGYQDNIMMAFLKKMAL